MKRELIDRYDNRSHTWYDEDNIPFNRDYRVTDEEGNLRYMIGEQNFGHELDSWYAGRKVCGAYAVFKKYESGLQQISPWYVMFGSAQKYMRKMADSEMISYYLEQKGRDRVVIRHRKEREIKLVSE